MNLNWKTAILIAATLFLCACASSNSAMQNPSSASTSPSADASLLTVTAPRQPATQWIDAWAVSFLPTTVNGVLQTVPTINNQTIRLNIFTKLGGTKSRVRFTNRFQSVPLTIASAHIAIRADHDTIVPETDRPLTFNKSSSITIASGDEIWSDPADLAIPQHADIAISLFIPQSIMPNAFHPTGLKTSYISAPGDFTGATAIPPAAANPKTTDMVFFVNDLQVMASARSKVIVTFGDSITDGSASTANTNTSWPDVLSKRLSTLPDGAPVSVINMGIGSNRIVSADAAGPAGVKRFDDDVLARPNVTHLIVLEGINDISYEHATADQLIAAYRQIITKAHAKGIKVFGATLLPIQNSRKDTPENEATRQAVNHWIRAANEYDGCLDFEKVVQDPQNPLRIRSDLTGDFVHPNSKGYQFIGESIDLKMFE